MRTITKVFTGVAAAAVTSFIAIPGAHADLSQCANGYACMWGENSYSGCHYKNSIDTGLLPTWATCPSSSANDGANSVRNQGNNCNVVFFEHGNYGGVGILFNRVIDGFNYQDPMLSNGGGIGFGGNVAGQNWQDRISSFDFCR